MKKSLVALAGLLLISACSTTTYHYEFAQACPLHMPSAPVAAGDGVIIRLLDHEAAMALLAETEARKGAPIDAAYMDNQRAVIRMADGRQATVLIPLKMQVAVGDRIAFQSNYRNTQLPCSYVPNLATQKF